MQIIHRLEALRRRENECHAAIVEALVECHRTKAHVDFGYDKLWTFLTEHLQYSSGAASRRYRAMHCAMKFPAVIDMLREQEITLCALSKLWSILDQVDDASQILGRVEGKSPDALDREIARERPQEAKPRERVRTVFVKKAQNDTDLFAGTNDEPAPSSTVEHEERFDVCFSLSARDYEQLQRARAILSRKLGREPSLEECVREFVDVYLDRKSPGRREARRGTPKTGVRKPSPPMPEASSLAPPNPTRSRHIPAATRDVVLLRDEERCTFVSPTGKRCGATLDLQLDHVVSFADGGPSDVGNLRVLCAAHNGRVAEVRFGARAPDERP